ncbi:hypothetical protein L218DRAFT_961361 [Marasmius fiardii PR-910]|nr:hypothetical protein L218DRAFT_961361 [Marasmius fiardii PR-910]
MIRWYILVLVAWLYVHIQEPDGVLGRVVGYLDSRDDLCMAGSVLNTPGPKVTRNRIRFSGYEGRKKTSDSDKRWDRDEAHRLRIWGRAKRSLAHLRGNSSRRTRDQGGTSSEGNLWHELELSSG